MAGLTGIELGPDCCALARVAWQGLTPTVSAAHIIASARWPKASDDLAEQLRHARSKDRFPRRAHVVVWNGLDRLPPAELAGTTPLRPFVSAGFEIDGVLSPAQALARIVGQRHGSREQATAALALNTHGAALAIVRGEQVLFSRMFAWAFGRPFTGIRSELLDRYLLVSQLAPELQRGISFVRPVHRAVVTSAIACGNLPNLRSLSMLLIQELDLEVETLDSATLIDLPNVDAAERPTLAESAAALQLAFAAALVDRASPIDDARGEAEARSLKRDPLEGLKSPTLLSVAVGATLVLGAVWSFPGWQPARPIADRAEILRVADQSRVADQTDQIDRLQVADQTDQIDRLRVADRTDSRVADRTDSRVADRTDSRVADQVRVDSPSNRPASGSEAAPGEVRARGPEPSVAATIGRFATRRPPAAAPRPAPLPEVEGVVISGDHRLALIGGLIVAQGDRVGSRAVVRIERDGVVLREPTGVEVFVPVRWKPPSGGTPDPYESASCCDPRHVEKSRDPLDSRPVKKDQRPRNSDDTPTVTSMCAS